MSYTLPNFRREIKMPWLVPQEAPDCKESLKQEEKMKYLKTPEFKL
jgi:hypothetical protein